MKTKWSSSWKSSKQPRKQRKYRHNAPLHIRRSFLSSHLSRELRKKFQKRAVPVRKGDKVKIMTGSFRGHTGSVDRVITKTLKVYVTGAERIKKDGSKKTLWFDPSNLLIMELNEDDKQRVNSLMNAKPAKSSQNSVQPNKAK